jgi:hypothetical protein
MLDYTISLHSYLNRDTESIDEKIMIVLAETRATPGHQILCVKKEHDWALKKRFEQLFKNLENRKPNFVL